MRQCFDKDFLKFLISFIAVVVISLVFAAILRDYEVGSNPKSDAPRVYTATPQAKP
jgi:hypothetical protein